ncbi:unnamed protein product [Lota lota]
MKRSEWRVSADAGSCCWRCGSIQVLPKHTPGLRLNSNVMKGHEGSRGASSYRHVNKEPLVTFDPGRSLPSLCLDGGVRY